jgi:hypothetical protein
VEPRDYVPRPAGAFDDADVDIFAARPTDLLPSCVVPHALDDQWVPRELMRTMLAERRSLPELNDVRLPLMRKEYIRALVTARQVVINRTYLYRNDVVSSDYLADGQEREAFAQLLGQGVIVPFLLEERSPIEVADARDPRYAESVAVWNDLCRREPVYCVRLSWNDEENEGLVNERLFAAFANGIQRAEDIDYRRLLLDTGGQDVERFRRRLSELRLIGRPSTQLPITRTTMYQKFVLSGDGDVKHGSYDPDKPFITAVKWFLDLLYNANLADALGLGLVTPADSLHRSLLHPPTPAPSADRPATPAIMETIQNALFLSRLGTEALNSFDGLTLSDVLRIRASQPWEEYAHAVDDLLQTPWLMSHPERGVPSVYRKYGQLVRYVADLR